MKAFLIGLVLIAAIACWLPPVEAQLVSAGDRAVDALYSLSMMTRLLVCLGCIGMVSILALARGGCK